MLYKISLKRIFLFIILIMLLSIGLYLYIENNHIKTMIKNKSCTNEYSEDVREIDFDSVYFGRYEQDGISDNGKEDIEWIILNKDFENNEILLMSKYSMVHCFV